MVGIVVIDVVESIVEEMEEDGIGGKGDTEREFGVSRPCCSLTASFSRTLCGGVSFTWGNPACGPRKLRMEEKCSQS